MNITIINTKLRGAKMTYRFNKSLYSKVALLKAAYNYTDKAYIHLDVDGEYYYVNFEMKPGSDMFSEKEFTNEMLAQAVRHEVYIQTKNIRELMLARAMATTIVTDTDNEINTFSDDDMYSEDEILKDWFDVCDESGDK